ncbi:NAD(P)H-dependent oxidoreductase subunit E, partial [Ramlibacter sp.]|uniref:NAD(P)H-dependent oxidoreductase subunit E n=1 Tax=Ramlibacter sp. TaxID=1917967 RepID=UPI002D69A033
MNPTSTDEGQAAVPPASEQALRTIRRQAKLKGRQPEEQALAEVRECLGPRPAEGHRRDLLIEYLHRLNDRFGALREPHLVALARETGIPMAEVYEVASFYHHFEVVPADAAVPALTVRVCDSLSCSLAGSRELLERLPALLGTEVRVVAAPCIGRCEQAPAVAVHQAPVPHATTDAVLQVVRAHGGAAPEASVAGTAFDPAAHAERSVSPPREQLQVLPAVTDYALYRAGGGYALPAALARGQADPDAVLRALEDSGLRGLGGAGFPAGRKWRIVREQPAPRLLAVNIDEGEPGTFKDRTFLERDPHRFLEGMLVAAQVVGIEAVYIYLRDEYHDVRRLLQREIDRLVADPPCPLPRIELRRGAGAYVCGEESAMIESIEGKRGEPRMRPPYIAQVGLFGRPTLEHNFETLYWVRDIVERGAKWFSSSGRNGRSGLRSFSVSGRVKQPGVKLAPAGITLRELVDEYCGGMQDGHELYAYLPGGASGGILPASLA